MSFYSSYLACSRFGNAYSTRLSRNNETKLAYTALKNIQNMVFDTKHGIWLIQISQVNNIITLSSCIRQMKILE